MIILFLLAGVILVKAAGSRKNGKDETAKVEKKNLVVKVTASGKIRAKKEIELKFQTSGFLSWVGVQEGDKVNAWQAIASLDKTELEKTLKKYLIDYSKERADFEETWRVTYQGRKRPEEALNDTMARILAKNQWDLDKAVLDVELKDIALKYATLLTPISGIVTRLDTPVAGVNITPSTAVFTISDPESLYFKADIDETDIGKISISQDVTITLDAYPNEEFTGRIERINIISITTSGGGTAFPVEIQIPKNKDLRFKIGMNGDVAVKIEERKDTLTLPVSAVQKEKEKAFVFIMKNGQKIKSPITAGIETEEDIEILSGLSEGEDVLLSSGSK